MSWLSSLFKSDNSAAEAAAAEAKAIRDAENKRQADVRAGQQRIDDAFGQFDPSYYENYRKSYTDFYNPQIADQYSRAADKLTATLAGRGTLESTVGAAKFGDLVKTRSEAETDIANRAFDSTNDLKQKVDSAKTGLYTLNTGSTDPTLAATLASGAASSFAAPPSLSPLGQVFSSVAQSLGAYNRADATSMNPRLPWNIASSAAPISGRGSSLYG